MQRAIAFVAVPALLEAKNVTGGGGPVLTDEEFAERYAKWESLYLTRDFATAATCTNDMRGTMPPCKQEGSTWCWATGIAELVGHYMGSSDTCGSVPCQIVSWCPDEDPPTKQCTTNHTECCPFHPMEYGEYCNLGGTWGMMTDSALHFTGRQHEFYGGPMSQGVLDANLAAGKPVLMTIGQKGTIGSHITSIAGCGGGVYFYHDPMTAVFNSIDYSTLLKPPNEFGRTDWVWIDTMYASSGPSPSPTPTPTPSPSPTPTPTPDCADSDANCASWASQGFCASTSEYYPFMQQSCQLSCGFCGGSCADGNANCGGYASGGYCSSSSQYYTFMQQNCQKACGFCSYSSLFDNGDVRRPPASEVVV